VRRYLPLHVVVGFLVIPPVLLKLGSVGYRFARYYMKEARIAVHHGSSYVWFVAAAIHVVNYARRAPYLAMADWRDHLRGTFTRQSLVVASLVAGGVLAVAMLSFSSPFALSSGGD